MIFDIGAEVLPCFYENVLHIKRTGSNVAGRFVGSIVYQETILAGVQPFKSRDLQNLPEGEQVVGAKSFYTLTELRTVDDKNAIIEDYLQHDGRLYKVVTVNAWGSYGYFRCVGTLSDKNIGDL